jgi:hypothetical protein
VLEFHCETIEVEHRLMPIGVAMASDDEYDPFRD